MKMMNRLMALILVGTMVFAFAACSSDDTKTSNAGDSAATETGTTETDATETDSAEGTLETATDGVLTMGTNAAFPPYEYYEGGEIVGIDAEVAAAIAEKLGLELEIMDMEFGSIIAAIQSGKIDMGMAGMTVTEERLQSVDFSTSYATGIQAIIVKEDSEITSVDDLFAEGANYTIGVQESTTGDIYSSGDIEDEGLGTISRYNKGTDAVQALITDKVDCVIIDNEPAKAFVEVNEGIKILDTEYVEEDYAIAFNKSNTALKDDVNEALEELIADGTVQTIIDKYVNAD